MTGSFSIQLSNILLNETEIPGQAYREIIIQPNAVLQGDLSMPDRFCLAPAYPNPFNPSTNLVFDLPHSSPVTLTVYNSLGQVVDILESGVLPAGHYIRIWDASQFATGIYFAEFNTGSYNQVRKLTLIN